MEIKLYDSTGKFTRVEEMKKLAQVAARICYSEKDADELAGEDYNAGLVEGRLIRSGHHSPFEHNHLTFYMNGIPKMLAMVLNNERQYVTSEKSARYTQMKNIVPKQKALYDKWVEKLFPLISQAYPEMKDSDAREAAIRKLGQENARYMTSVFTPTKMMHTINLRQLNFLINEFESYINEYRGKHLVCMVHNHPHDTLVQGRPNLDYLIEEGHICCAEEKAAATKTFDSRLFQAMKEFLDQTKELKVDGLENRTDRRLSIFDFKESSHHFGDVYSTQYFMSFAGLAQAHRHRTLVYNAQVPELNAPIGFYIPAIIRANDLEDDWLRDLETVAQDDFPQAQLLLVRERGTLEDFRSKCMLRLCGHAQHEIMMNTEETAIEYAKHAPEVSSWISAKCMQGFKCREPCIWTGKKALERIV